MLIMVNYTGLEVFLKFMQKCMTQCKNHETIQKHIKFLCYNFASCFNGNIIPVRTRK